MQTHHIIERNGKKTERVGIAQHRLVRKGKLANVFERLDIARHHSQFPHLLAIPRHTLVGPRNPSPELCKLQGADLFARHRFDLGLEHRGDQQRTGQVLDSDTE